MPLVTEPVIVRLAGSIVTSASLLPTSELEVRISSVAGLPAGKANLAEPVRGVAVSSVLTPESSPTW